MGTRVGIELSPVACRILELEGPALAPGQAPATRVRSYAVLPPSGPETDRRFALLGRRPVAVVVWGVRRDHRQVVVSNGSYETMRAEALASARAAGVDTHNTIADIASASTAIKGATRQQVVLVLAGADELSTAIRPLIKARLRIRSVVTPADALLGLARSRQAFALPGGIEAYVALDATMTCLALVRDGSLLSACELSWGYEARSGAPPPPQAAEAPEVLSRRDDLATRLLDELAALLTTVGADRTAVTQVSICGGLPDLRTMTVPLMEHLDVEVETLDSLFGMDAEHLPEPADEFRDRAVELRLAWAAAADWRGPINLMRYRRRRNRRVALARVAVVAGVAAGLGAGLAIQRSQWWASTAPERVVRRTAPAAVPPPPSPPARGNAAPRPQAPAAAASVAPVRPPMPPPIAPAVIPSPATAATSPVMTASKAPSPVPSTPATTLGPPPAVARAPGAAPPVARVTPPTTSTPAASAASAAPVTTPRQSLPAAVTRPTPPAPALARVLPPVTPPVKATPPRVLTPRPPALIAAPPASATPPPATAARPPARATPSPVFAPSVVGVPAPREEAASAAAVGVPPPVVRRVEPPPIPFDAQLGTILYAPDRKFAIVNGRIVGPGDEVDGARIVDITPTTVLLRDAQGRLRSLTLVVGRPP